MGVRIVEVITAGALAGGAREPFSLLQCDECGCLVATGHQHICAARAAETTRLADDRAVVPRLSVDVLDAARAVVGAWRWAGTGALMPLPAAVERLSDALDRLDS